MTVRGAPFIAVSDVVASSDWYGALLGCPSQAVRDGQPDHPHRREYDKIVNDDGETLLMLHGWDAQPEVAIDRWFVNRDAAPRGHGVLLTFGVDDLDATLQRARAMSCEIVEDVHLLSDRSRCFWVRDPDGYMLQLGASA
jgi:catechol 2,3-dioxygenase-like lactoylglutathione lyase family enzyme